MCRGRRQRTCPVGRDPCVPPQHTHYSRRGTRAPPYRVRRSYRADRVVRPYKAEQEPCETGRRTPRAFVPLRSTAGRRPLHMCIDGAPFACKSDGFCVLPMVKASDRASGRGAEAHSIPVKAMDFASCRWQTDDGVPCVRRGGLTMAGHKRLAFTSWGACASVFLYLPPDMCWRRGSGRRSCSRPCRGRGAG